MENNYSLADLAAATGGSGFGGNWGGALGGGLVGYILGASNGGGGILGGGNRGTAATTEDVASGFNSSALQGKTNDILAAVNGVNQNLSNAVCSGTYEIASKVDQCCCNTQMGVQQVRYDMATQNGDIKALIHSEAEATRNMMRDAENANLRQQLSYSQMQGLLCGIPRASNVAWTIAANPACFGQCTPCANI